MKQALLAFGLLGIVGCGRIGFDDGVTTTGDAAADGPGTGGAELVAVEVTQATITDGIPVTMLAITRVAVGHAVLWIGAPPSPAFGFLVDTNARALRADAPQVSPDVGAMGYESIALSTHNGVIVGAVQMLDGTMFLKTFLSDLSKWATADLHVGTIARPTFGNAGSMPVAIFNDGGIVAAVRVDANGFEVLPQQSLGVGTTGVMSTASLSGALAVFLETTPGACRVLVVSPSLTAALDDTVYAPCERPFIGSRGDSSAILAYEVGDTVQVARLLGPPMRTITGSDPRVSTLATAECVSYLAGGIFVEPVSGPNAGMRAVVTGVPAGAPDAYEIEGDTGFAMYGDRLFRFPACF